MGIVLSNVERMALLSAARIMAPPPPVDFAAWATQNIVFSARETQFPGPYNRDSFPYFDEILDALGPDDPCRTVTLNKSAQLGGTVIASIFTLGSLSMDPGDFLYVHPSDDNARRWSKLKLAPMLRNTPSLGEQFPEKSRDGGDSILFKERRDGRGSILITGANSPSSLSQVSMSRQVQDDLSKWELNSAGDPEVQADSRSRGYEYAKVFKISTPLILPGCRISSNFEKGSQERFHVPCPHCGHEHLLEWENMLANLDPEKPEDAHFTCPECGATIEEHHRPAMLRKGRWIAENPKAKRNHRSFALWSAYSPLQSFERIANEWLSAKGDPAKEQVFLNDTVGKAYQAKGEAPPWETVRDRAQASPNIRGRIPFGYSVLTLGLDCQGDRVEWQLVGWASDLRRHVIDVGVVAGHISDETARKRLDELLRSTWKNVAGNQIGVDKAAIDGNAFTEDVWEWAKRHPAAKLMMVRGSNTDTAPRLQRVKKERGQSGKLLKYSSRFYNFNTSIRKDSLYRCLTRPDPMERSYIGLPRGLEDAYFQQLTAERRVAHKRKDGFIVYRWEKDATQANEALDTMIQAEVAAEKLGVRSFTSATWHQLELERETVAPDAQMDIEDMPLVMPVASTHVTATPPRKQRFARLKRR